jgi:hypothetical protein
MDDTMIMKNEDIKNNFSGYGTRGNGSITPLMRKEECGVSKVNRIVEPFPSITETTPNHSQQRSDLALFQANLNLTSLQTHAVLPRNSENQLTAQAALSDIYTDPSAYAVHSNKLRSIDPITANLIVPARTDSTSLPTNSNTPPQSLFPNHPPVNQTLVIDENGNSALIAAAYSNNLPAIRALIEHRRIPLNLQNYDGETALSVAVMNNNYDIAKFLIDRGADLNMANYRCESPLHQAVVLGNIEISRLLIEGGSYVDAEDECGETPLHFAVREDQVEIVEYLLSIGADPDHSNQDDETPAELAEMVASQAVKQVFLENCKKYIQGKTLQSIQTSPLGSKSHLLLKKSQKKLATSCMLSPLSASLALPVRFFMDRPNSSE